MAKSTTPTPIKELSDRELQESILRQLKITNAHQKKIRSRVGVIEWVVFIFFVLTIVGGLFSIMGAASALS
ncbi:MAG: hypothetical protein U5L96_13380 [Owenweeksia sp.]|nr:hypothetical protein [Owenweeksia sp.]